MAVTITRTPWVDDDGTGTTGTVLNNAVKTELYNQIDAALAGVVPGTGLWTDYVPTVTANTGTVALTTNFSCRYTLVGKIMTVSLFVDLTPSATPTSIQFSLPAGTTTAAGYTNGVAALPASLGTAVIQAAPSLTVLNLLRDIQASGTFPATVFRVGLTLAFAVA